MSGNLDNFLFDAFANASENTFIYVADLKSGECRWSKQAVEFWGLEGEYFTNATDKWLEHVHPDDRKMFRDDITPVTQGKFDQHSCQYRAKNRDGEYIWVECKGSLIRDENGEASMFAGMMTRLDNQSKYDELTHLLTGAELLHKTFEDNGCLMLIGADGLRNINSRHGLRYGNSILKYLADTIVENAAGMVVYRFRGDEFAVYGKNTSVHEMSRIYRKVNKICSDAESNEGLISFSASAGIVQVVPGDEASDMLSKAELSLLHAKEVFKSGMAIYSEEIEQKQLRKNTVSETLLHSIKNCCKGFYLVYQPILSNNGETIVGCESLLRWDAPNPAIGKCFPDEFIPILEKNGGIKEVGSFVMREAIKQASVWQKKYKNFSVSFNVSYFQLEDSQFVPSIISTIDEYGVNPEYITVELTESVLNVDTDMVKKSFELLKGKGIKIALDDFGTGNSSFWTLHNIDIDIVKLDQSFIRGLSSTDSGIDYAIVESVGLMCNRVGYKTVAEGVETDDIWKMISKFDFSGLQGYLFSRPVEIKEFEKLLNKYNMKA